MITKEEYYETLINQGIDPFEIEKYIDGKCILISDMKEYKIEHVFWFEIFLRCNLLYCFSDLK